MNTGVRRLARGVATVGLLGFCVAALVLVSVVNTVRAFVEFVRGKEAV